MEQCFKLTETNPENSANVFSKLFFGWTFELFRKGCRQYLTIKDLYQPLASDESESLVGELEKHWENEIIKCKLKNIQPSLAIAIKNAFFQQYMFYGILLFLRYCIIRASQPIILSRLIALFSDTGEDHVPNSDIMYIYGTILVLQSVVGIFIDHHTNLEMGRIGMKVRVAVCSLVYRKVLKLNKKAVNQTDSGQIINLLSNDVIRFDHLAIVAHHLWIAPIQTILIIYLIYQELHVSAFAGGATMFMMTVPIFLPMGTVISKLRMKVANKTDYRIRLMNEILSGIQVIKMFVWEKPFEMIVRNARNKEIEYITKASYIRGIFFSCMVYTDRTAVSASIICYAMLGQILTADKVFATAQFFNILQLSAAIFFPLAYAICAETYTTVNRLEKFLLLEEKPQTAVKSNQSNINEISISNGTASWTKNSVTLNKINVKIPQGTLCAIVGPVGSGKSSLLQLILGELVPTDGSDVEIHGEISYAAQEPWLFGSTVRNNILFGQPYNEEMYKQVVRVCALKSDFEQFPLGDLSPVGEKGVSLSGGQKARINLARAVYRQADIYLLDDPISAVDTHVGKHLFEKCILKYLGNKTRILVTHQLQYLKKADFIIVLNRGIIEAQGTFDELTQSKLNFTKLLVAANETTADGNCSRVLKRNPSKLSTKSVVSEYEKEEEEAPQEETFTQKQSGISVYLKYFKAGGSWLVLMLLCLFLLTSQGVTSGLDYWMSYWTKQEALRHHSAQTNTPTTLNVTSAKVLVTTEEAIFICICFTIGSIFITLVRSIFLFVICMAASKTLHQNMFEALLRAPMRFFSTNPSGRVLNRFSKDLGTIDESLPSVIMEASQILLIIAGITVTISVINYYMIIVVIVIAVVFLQLRKLFVYTAKDVRRLEAIAKSPVFSHVNSTLNGLTTIRALKTESILKKEFDSHQDIHSSAWYLSLVVVEACGLWLDFLCAIFVACVTFSFIFMNLSNTVNSSTVGLAISQSLMLMGMLQLGLKLTAEFVNQMTSVERVLQYTKIDREGTAETPEDKLVEEGWPLQGRIQFEKLTLKYSLNEPPVLNDLNFSISAGEKIGIVGRTGAGKSSIISAIFRLAPIDGTITIDGIDTQSIGLSNLRKHISIIPQEPTLFSECIRYNLDPFGEFTDDEVWSALKEVELKDTFSSLGFPIEGNGCNLSVGQKQLICLARAILRNNKILILDEATANVDPSTDALIQATIRRKFTQCTLLTIAHRLHTIMDSDRVFVIDKGSMVEFGHPHELLQDQESYFSKLVAENESDRLRNTALQSYQLMEEECTYC